MNIYWMVECLPEDTPVRGDDRLDRECEDTILHQLKQGNSWAWCCVKVTGHYLGLSASEYLGACSYQDSTEFEVSDSYLEMQRAVEQSIRTQIARIIGEHTE